VPAWIGELVGLRTLDLGHNALLSVPDLAALRSLEILYLHDNALRALPALPPTLTY
jgi:Leucine-rich repeat (LRR) protein